MAEDAVALFHTRMNSEQFEAIYDDAHEIFKSANSKEVIIPAMRVTHERLGKVVQVTERWINYVSGDPVPIRAVYNIKCEKGDFSEWFAYVISNDGTKALLVQYQNFPGFSPPPDSAPK